MSFAGPNTTSCVAASSRKLRAWMVEDFDVFQGVFLRTGEALPLRPGSGGDCARCAGRTWGQCTLAASDTRPPRRGSEAVSIVPSSSQSTGSYLPPPERAPRQPRRQPRSDGGMRAWLGWWAGSGMG